MRIRAKEIILQYLLLIQWLFLKRFLLRCMISHKIIWTDEAGMNIIYISEKWKLEPQEITCLEQFQATHHEQDNKQSLCFSKSHLWASSIIARDLYDFTKQSTSSGRPWWVPDAYLLKMIIMIMVIAIIWNEQMVSSQREPSERGVYGIL